MAQLLRRNGNVTQVSKALYGHSGFVEGLLPIPSGMLVSVDSHGEVIVWNVEQQRPIEQFAVSTSSLQGVGAIPGTEDIAVWGWDGALLRLSLPDLTGIVRVDVHSDRILNTHFGFVGSRRVAATASMDRTAALVDIDSGDVIFRTDPHGFWVVQAYVWSDMLVTVSRDGTVRMFEPDGTVLHVFRQEGAHFVSAALHGSRLVAASIDGTILCVDLEARTGDGYPNAVGSETAVIGFDGDFVVLGDSNGDVSHFEFKTGEVSARIAAHEGGVLGGAIGHDLVVTYGLDRVATVMRAGTLERVRRIDAHDNLVGTATFMNGQVVTGSADTSIKFHEPEASAGVPVERHKSLVTGMEFMAGRLVSWGYSDPVARAWDPATGKVVARRAPHFGDVRSVTRLGDGWLSTSNDGTAKLSPDFDGTGATTLGLPKGIRDGAITGPTSVVLGTMIGWLIHLDVDHGELWRFEHPDEIVEVQADRTTETIGFCDRQNVVLLDDSGAEIVRFSGRAFVLLDATLWVFGDGDVARYNVLTGETETLSLDVGVVDIAMGNRWGIVAVDAGGRIVAMESDGTLRWQTRVVEHGPSCMDLADDLVTLGWHHAGAVALDIRDGHQIRRDPGDPAELVVDVAGDPDSGRFAIVGWDEVRVLTLDGEESFAVGGLDPRPDGVWFVGDALWIAAFGSLLYRWYPLEDELSQMVRHDSVMSGLSTLDDGRMVTWGWDGRVIVNSVDGRFQRDWGGHGSFVFGGCDLPEVGVVTWSFDATARVWDSEGREKEVFRTRTRGIEAGTRSGDTIWLGTSAGELYAWAPRQRRVMLFESGDWHGGAVKLLVGNDDFVASACRAGRLGIWSPDQLANVAFWDVPESGGFTSLCADSRRSLVAAGGNRGRIIAVDPVGGRVIFDVVAHGAAVRGLVFAPDDDILFSTSEDGTLAAWDRDGELLARTRLDGKGYSIAADRGGLVAAGDAAGRVLFFDFATEVH